MRTGFVGIGSTLLWFGTSQISIAGLMMMLLGLIAVVAAFSVPLPRLRTICPPRTLAQAMWHPWRISS